MEGIHITWRPMVTPCGLSLAVADSIRDFKTNEGRDRKVYCEYWKGDTKTLLYIKHYLDPDGGAEKIIPFLLDRVDITDPNDINSPYVMFK